MDKLELYYKGKHDSQERGSGQNEKLVLQFDVGVGAKEEDITFFVSFLCTNSRLFFSCCCWL